MDLLGQYDSGNEGSSDGEPAAPDTAQVLRPLKQSVSAAPDVSTVGMALVSGAAVPESETTNFLDPGKRVVYYNMKYDDMHEPVAGPAHPYQKDGLAAGQKNHKLGFVEDAHMSSFMFDEQYQTFHSHGYAADPSGQHYVGDGAAFAANGGGSVYQTGHAGSAGPAKRKKKRQKVAEEDGEDLAGEEWEITRAMPWADKGGPEPQELTEEQKEYLAAYKAKKAKKGGAAAEEADKEDQSVFHGKEEKDYQGRPWLEAPKDLKKQNDQCFIPKRWVHTWSGHTKGVSAIRFFPTTGHLLLSAGMDSKVKIWDVNGSGKCMRTYMGHSKAVRDICFSNDGRRFLTASYDKQIKLWDTETGKVLGSYSTGKIPFCVKFHPSDDKQNTILAGMSDKKIIQWDTSTGDQTQEYDQHLGAVNTITFVDNNRRFVTSSDDKTLRVWEFGIPVVIKYIAEPHMHSMPSIAVHPNGNWFVGQSLDNQILTYSTKERFRINRKKTFKGHTNAGYACQVGFSPDGRFVLSGDADGKCWFWDWKTTKVFRTLKAHEGVCIGAQWHPLETSKVATCGWDGAIKYWDCESRPTLCPHMGPRAAQPEVDPFPSLLPSEQAWSSRPCCRRTCPGRAFGGGGAMVHVCSGWPGGGCGSVPREGCGQSWDVCSLAWLGAQKRILLFHFHVDMHPVPLPSSLPPRPGNPQLGISTTPVAIAMARMTKGVRMPMMAEMARGSWNGDLPSLSSLDIHALGFGGWGSSDSRRVSSPPRT